MKKYILCILLTAGSVYGEFSELASLRLENFLAKDFPVENAEDLSFVLGLKEEVSEADKTRLLDIVRDSGGEVFYRSLMKFYEVNNYDFEVIEGFIRSPQKRTDIGRGALLLMMAVPSDEGAVLLEELIDKYAPLRDQDLIPLISVIASASAAYMVQGGVLADRVGLVNKDVEWGPHYRTSFSLHLCQFERLLQTHSFAGDLMIRDCFMREYRDIGIQLMLNNMQLNGYDSSGLIKDKLKQLEESERFLLDALKKSE